MTTLASCVATVTGRGCTVDVDARADSGVLLADVEGETDASALSALRPRGGVQRVGLRIYYARGGEPFNRVMVPDSSHRIDPLVIGGWRLSSGIVTPESAASFVFTATDSPFSAPINSPAPSPAGYQFDVLLAYRYGDDGEMELPLMQFGLADQAVRSDSGPMTDAVTVVGVVRRNRHNKVTLQLPAGHGWTYAQVIRRLLQLGWGYPANQFMVSVPPIAGDFAFRKEINLVSGDWLALAQELADIWGLAITDNEWGQTITVEYAPERTRGPLQGVIDERDILRSVNGSPESVTITPIPYAYIDICLQGTAQVTRPGSSFRKSIPLPSVSYARFAPAVARYLHNSNDTYTDTGTTAETRDGKRSETDTVLDIDGETVVGIDTTTKGWLNHSAARYTIDTALALTPIGGVYVEEQTAGALAYAWPVERYLDLSHSTTVREFDDSNRLRRDIVETEGWLHKKRAIQSRPDLNTSWEDTMNAPGISGMVLGNGEGVTTARPVWALLTRDTTEHESSEDGYRVRRRRRVESYGAAEGWEYRYGDGRTSSESEETFQLLLDEEELWMPVPGREDIHVYRKQRFGPGGVLLDALQETRQGYLEAADARTDIAPARENFESDADWQLARAASRFDTQAIAVELHDQGMLDVWRVQREPEQITVHYAQAPWQLLNIGRRMFLAGKARTVTFSVPPNPGYKRGQWWRLRYRRPGMDIDHDACIVASEFEQRGNQGPIVQRLTVAVN